MIITALVALGSLLLAVLFRNRPVVWLSAGFAVLILIPRVATRVWLSDSGLLANLHPAFWVFLAGTIVTLISTRRTQDVDRRGRQLAFMLVTWALISTLLVSLAWGNPASFVLLLVAPTIAFFSVTVVRARSGTAILPMLARVVLMLAVAQSALALVQWLTKDVLFFSEYYATNYWWRESLTRSVGTLDSPLDLAALLTMSLPLIARVRRTPAAIAIAVLLLAGVFVSGSRVGIVVAVVVLAWVLIAHSRNFLVGTLIALVMSAGAVVFLSSSLALQLLDRFGTRGDVSTGVRETAFDVGLGFVFAQPWLGGGMGFAYEYSSGQLDSSFENAYLSSAIDVGLPIVLSLLLLQLLVTFQGNGGRLLDRLPGVLAIVWGFAYSSFASASVFGMMAWFFIGLAAISAVEPSQPRRRARTFENAEPMGATGGG